jgi:hypothetical protein
MRYRAIEGGKTELHRGEGRLRTPGTLSNHLVDRDVVHVRDVGVELVLDVIPVGAGEECAGQTAVARLDLLAGAEGRVVLHVREHDHLLFEGSEWLEQR